jgi:hypothetical protein
MVCRFQSIASILLVSLVGGGCASTSSTPDRHAGAVSAGLVMPGSGWSSEGTAPAPSWPVDPGAWETARNDALLNASRTPLRNENAWALITTRDRTRTSNGRPREFSTTFVRTLTLRQVR